MHVKESFAARVHRRSDLWRSHTWGLDCLPCECKIIFMYWFCCTFYRALSCSSIGWKKKRFSTLLFGVLEKNILKTLRVIISVNSWNNDTRRHRRVLMHTKVSDLPPLYSGFFFQEVHFLMCIVSVHNHCLCGTGVLRVLIYRYGRTHQVLAGIWLNWYAQPTVVV